MGLVGLRTQYRSERPAGAFVQAAQERRCFGSGDRMEAVRPSAAEPGLFAPFDPADDRGARFVRDPDDPLGFVLEERVGGLRDARPGAAAVVVQDEKAAGRWGA